jgi:hypothetical protein
VYTAVLRFPCVNCATSSRHSKWYSSITYWTVISITPVQYTECYTAVQAAAGIFHA